MPAHRSLLPALVAAAVTVVTAVTATALLAVPAGAASRAAPAAADDDPLSITIDTLNPSVIPERGRVMIFGTVTNTSDETWVGVNLYPLTSSSLPMTTVAELEAAVQTDVDTVVGERIIEVVDRIDELAPGEVASYALRIPRRYLGRDEGVHWLGVHALAQNAEGRDDQADGKARTFLPLIGKQRPALKTALVLQLRRGIRYAVDGRIDGPEQWAADLATGGRLRSVIDVGAAAGDRPMSLLLDPAVIATVNALVGGNDSRMPVPEPADEEEAPGEAPPATTGEALSDPTDPVAVAAAATEGQEWLSRLPAALAGKQLLALPYGDVDASAASTLQPGLLAEAHTTSAAVMAELGLISTRAIGSPSGYLDPDAIRAADTATTVLGSSASVDIDAPAVADVGGQEVVLSSATAVEGGPGPDDPLATVAVRQRILSEAAVRLLSPGREPLVVTLPTDWTPTDATGFFTGFDVDWIELSKISDLTGQAGEPESIPAEDFVYPEFQEEFELDSTIFTAASELIAAGRTMQQVLVQNTTVGDAVTREAYTETSYWQRARAEEARVAATRSRGWIEATLGRVTVDGPPSVTLSSATGQFPATVTNGLDEPVLVRLDAEPSSGLTVEVPETFELDPGESTRLRLSATTVRIGAHSLVLRVAAADGTPLGAAAELPIRSNQVSEIIWIVMVAGGGLLFGAIAVRLVRRIRRTRTKTAA
ncbi:MAG: DUF6049 family protein [Nocardioides sp.]